jgi:ribonucleoside-diphosphate reductase alpha chain
LQNVVLNLDVMPSMRALMTAGEALQRDHVAGYNCAFVAVNRLRAFDEILYILMCGTGVGFSVEQQFVNKLPTIAEEFSDSDTIIVVEDSKIGWAKAFKELDVASCGRSGSKVGCIKGSSRRCKTKDIRW